MNPAAARPASDILRRVQSEFLEMPGLRLTEQQARRLWGLAPLDCYAVLSALVDAGFLFRTRDGSFMRIEQSDPMTADSPARSGAHRKIPAA